MPNINLLPWREERREELKREFGVMVGAAAAMAVVIMLGVHQYYASEINHQNARNSHLQNSINVLNAQIKEIQDLEKTRDLLLARMRVIQDLQGNRPVIVRLFDELVRTLPDGVYFTEVQYDEAASVINLKGTAESNMRVSSLMRALDASDWFADPNLTAVTGNQAAGENGNNFEMRVKLSKPKRDEDEEAANG